MSVWLIKEQLKQLKSAATKGSLFPMPTQVISNGEYMPPPQTDQQRQVEATIIELADTLGPKVNLKRRQFLRTGFGMATAFLAMNKVYGPVFRVAEAETLDIDALAERTALYKDQFIFDDHLHFVNEKFAHPVLFLMREQAKQLGNLALEERKEPTYDDFRFDAFVKEIYLDSDTTVGLISTAAGTKPENTFLSNEQMADGATRLNQLSESRRLLKHAAIKPGTPGWLDEIEHILEIDPPHSWKGYTVGAPFVHSIPPYRLDDEELMYPFYERSLKAGIKNICIHKGMLPPDYKNNKHYRWEYAGVDDVPKAAQDWPQINFIIYHSAIEYRIVPVEEQLSFFDRTGRINWVSDLAEIPAKYGVSNVYADLGGVFGFSCVTEPQYAASLLGILIKGLGADHVVWGTDALWQGTPQWQIEALRRIEIPEAIQKKYGFAPLGDGNSLVKQAIFGQNSARLYNFTSEQAAVTHYQHDRLTEYKQKYHEQGAEPSNIAYGFIHPG